MRITPAACCALRACCRTKELKEAIAGIQATLTTAVVALDIAAAAEKDPSE